MTQSTMDLFEYISMVQKYQLAVKERAAYKKMLDFYREGLFDLSDSLDDMSFDELKTCIKELSDKSIFED